MHKKYILWIILSVPFLAFTLSGPVMSNVEQAKYEVIQVDDQGFEMRVYTPAIAAEVDVSGERKDAISKGFKIIADYIFGNNKSSHKIAMTVPVIQEQNQPLAVLAPLTQQGKGNSWKVRFIMPDQYTLETLPKPNNASIKIVELPIRKFAVICFSGTPDNDDLNKKSEQLRNWMQKKDIQAMSGPVYAFYNPPWTIPFLRRNEVMIQTK